MPLHARRFGPSARTGALARWPSPTLRELALRAVADEVGDRAASRRQHEGLQPALIPERVMVCSSSSADAPRVLRAGSRIAGRLGARWYAVYVKTPREAPGHIKPHDREALQRNIALAEELGATVVRVKADRPSDGLIAFAKREGITHVIFGQSARSRSEIMRKGSTLNRFLEEVRGRRHSGRAARGMTRPPPPPDGDNRPDRFDDPEWPGPLQKAVRGTQRTCAGKREDEPVAAGLQRVEDQHQADRNQTKEREAVHV